MTRSQERHAARRQQRLRSPLAALPFSPLVNPLPPTELLSSAQIEQIHQASLWILEEVGLDFLDAEVLSLWEQAGAKVDHAAQHAWLDRGLVLEAVAKAPASFTLRARNPARSMPIGGNHSIFFAASGMPFVADAVQGRRPGTLADYRRCVQLAQSCPPIHAMDSQINEPQDLPVEVRHLERLRALWTLSDKVVSCPAHGRTVARDVVAMAALVFGGEEELRRQPCFASVVNVNSPLRYDSGMLGGLLTYAQAGQPLVITPFILAGAMSPITMAAALAQQNAEALAGIALTQLANPGVPVIYGGFTTNTDMATGSPAFGTPEGAWAFFAGAQLARRYGLPYRGSGGLTTAKLPDAQAAYETQMCLWPNILGHANYIMHAAGWLEGGLVFSFEKCILDCEQLAMFQHLMQPSVIDTANLALDSIQAVGPGGHHFGTAHTLARYENAFYRPTISDRQNIGAWEEAGGLDAAQRATRVWQELLAAYEAPPIDPGLQEDLGDFVQQRRHEIEGR